MITAKRDFSYSKNNVSLNFTLTDKDLKPFLSLLKQAQQDIEKTLEGMKN